MITSNKSMYVLAVVIAVMAIMCAERAYANYVEITPVLETGGIYDDNITLSFDDQESLDDFGYIIRPELNLDYITNTFRIGGTGIVDFLRYIEETDFDRTNQFYTGNVEVDASERFGLFGDYTYIRDESIDTRFNNTGRVFKREPEEDQIASGGFRFDFTELTSIEPKFVYKNVEFDEEDSVDYERYTVELPIIKELKNQRDRITLRPGYSRYENELDNVADDFRLTVGWYRRVSEKFNFNINLGGRYTITENADGEEDDNWNGVALITLDRKGETFTGKLRLSNNLRSDNLGNLINVSRIGVLADQKITERFGFDFDGGAWYSYKERDVEGLEDDQVISFKVRPGLYYLLTENHSISFDYQYTFTEQLDEEDRPQLQRNVFTLFLNLNFPRRWDF